MGTVFKVDLLSHAPQADEEALDECFKVFRQVDVMMSEWKPASPVSHVARQAGISAVTVPDDLVKILDLAQQVSRQTAGAFDVTWAALWGLWRFDHQARVPSADELARQLPLVNWQDLQIDRRQSQVFLRRKGMSLGLGAIAKGYALDLAADSLRKRAYRHFLLYAGGQVLASGKKLRDHWLVGIKDPRRDDAKLLARLHIKNQSVATSGDYEKYFIKDGQRYHHILDPRTGHPVSHLRSATVIADKAVLADAYSTASFVLGPEKSLKLAREAGFELLAVDQNGCIHVSDGLRRQIDPAVMMRPGC